MADPKARIEITFESNFAKKLLAQLERDALDATVEAMEILREYASGGAFGPSKARAYCDKHKIHYNEE